MTPRQAIERFVGGGALSEAETRDLVAVVLAGDATAAQVAGILVALRMKGETVDEIVGAARAMRAAAVTVPGVPPDAVDTCGTGGDGLRTLNVSTAAALVAAGAGVPVAKHGNRAISGTAGSADVLEALGVRVALDPVALGRCLHDVGIAFLFAPTLHPAMRHVAGPRRDLGVRTLFNLLGPLVNPAGVRRQVVGVPEARWVEVLAAALLRLGTVHAWVVHGAGGLDELGLEGESLVGEVCRGAVRHRRVRASDVGLASAPVEALRVASVADSAARIRAVLAGERGPSRDAVVLNAGAALVVGGAVEELAAGVARAAAAIDDGAAARVLERLVAFTATAPEGAP